MTKPGNGFKDMTAQTFGRLVVVEQAPSIGGSAAWLCRCECGGELVVKGFSLRRGSVLSCGCGPKGPRAARSSAPPKVEPGWMVVDRDGLLALVENLRGDCELIEFDVRARCWTCSACGPMPKVVCGHAMPVTRSLPLEVAARIASLLAPNHGGPLSAASGGAKDGEAANEQARAAALAKSAIARAERLREHDEEHRRATAEVAVRQMTDEDRARLAERRARKRGVFAH